MKCTQKLKSESSEKFYSKKTFKFSSIWHFPNLYDERKETPVSFIRITAILSQERLVLWV